MGAQFTIDVKQRLVVVTFPAETTEEEIIDLASRIRSHPDFDPSFSEIVDCSAASGAGISSAAIERISRRENIFDRTSLHVIVAPRDHVFGLVRMAQTMAEQTVPNVAVVRTMEEAHRVLAAAKSGTK